VKGPKEVRERSPIELVSAQTVERCKKGDRAAWDALVQATYREVYTLCLRVLRDEQEALDATQDTYLKVWRGIKGFRGDAAFTTWLYRVAMNASLSRNRGSARRRSMEIAAEPEVLLALPASDSTEAAAGARVELGVLEVALAALPEDYRVAVVLRDVYGRSIAEIAEATGISETAAKVRVHRARKKLKSMVYPEDTGDKE
jgi:RNA polymerase sigma-70 factor (ECF subfamily)